MTRSTPPLPSTAGTAFKSKNKDKRHNAYLKIKKARESVKRDHRLKRKREEDKNPHLRVKRRAKNVPTTIDQKRAWDEVEEVGGDGLGLSIDLQSLKQCHLGEQTSRDPQGLTESKLQRLKDQSSPASNLSNKRSEQAWAESDQQLESDEDDLGSLLEDSDEEEERSDKAFDDSEHSADEKVNTTPSDHRPSSPSASTASTNMSLIPDALAAKFPTLFKPPSDPKILITTNLGGSVHKEAELLTALFPNSMYKRRQRHRYNSHHFSIREIARGAANRGYTALIVLNEDQKRPSGLTVVHIPSGPTFHFSLRNWIEGKKLPNHGNPTDHYPELILNNFRTPLGLVTAHLFHAMFPPRPDIEGRQVVTLHNQRDYIFVRRHRYVFREKRATEKSTTGSNGQTVSGMDEVKAGLQELGPRFTLKLRRIDKGIQRASGQEWEWKAGMDSQRTKFQL